MAIYFTSDLHFGHNKEFLYGTRGFNSIDEHDQKIVENWNNLIQENDEVYVLGDIMVGGNYTGIENLRSLNGTIHIIIGNHDSSNKITMYKESDNVVEVVPAAYIKISKKTLYLSHYPSIVTHDKFKSMREAIINFFGHTHQHTNFYLNELGQENPFMYHVGLDSHNNTPVSLEEILDDIRKKKNEYS